MSTHQPSALPDITPRADSRQSRNSHTSNTSRNISASPPDTRQSSTPSPGASNSSHSSTRKQPSFSETALQISSSPPLTSFLNDRHSASSAQEEAYLTQSFRLRIVRLVLSVLTVAIALAAVGVEGHVLKSYNDTKLGSKWHLTLWPINIDLKPTLGILVPAAIVAVANISYVVVAAVPSPRSRTSLLTGLYVATTTTSVLVSIFALIFSPVLTHRIDPHMSSMYNLPRDTLQSFTCRYYNNARKFNSQSAELGIPMFGEGLKAPLGFGRMCVETQAGVRLMVAVAVFCLAGLAIGLWGVRAEKKIERGRRERWEGKWESKA